jgi:hypothetical protein
MRVVGIGLLAAAVALAAAGSAPQTGGDGSGDETRRAEMASDTNAGASGGSTTVLAKVLGTTVNPGGAGVSTNGPSCQEAHPDPQPWIPPTRAGANDTGGSTGQADSTSCGTFGADGTDPGARAMEPAPLGSDPQGEPDGHRHRPFINP